MFIVLRQFAIINVFLKKKSTYNGAKCRVLHNGTLSAPFGSGVRQGCISTPVLFLVVIGDIIQTSIAKHLSVCKYSGIRWKMDSFLQLIDYGDDICLLSHSILHTANMLYSLENEAASFVLKINSGQMKSMSIVNSSTTRQPRSNAIVLNEHPV